MAESKLYLQLLGLERQPPALPFLNAICTAHLQTGPLANGVEGLPTVHEFLQGRRHHSLKQCLFTCEKQNANLAMMSLRLPKRRSVIRLQTLPEWSTNRKNVVFSTGEKLPNR
ncbi:hypothetical protein MKZ19_20720 [Shouchella clausii]|uniref:hypothetical protein n=1 Tax=Shouchella clausii TaxID=79880 RepID=UPI0031FDFD0C